MTRLGILGGTFDPPHIGHLILAQNAFENFKLDKVLFVPAAIQPHKQKRKVSPPEVRLRLLQLALEGDDRFDISDIELKRSGPSYTIDSLRSLQKLYKGIKLYFIIGGDNISDIATWKDPDKIFEIADVVAVLRPDSQFEGPFKDRITLFNMPQIEISSSEIRKLVGQGKSVKYLVPDKVEKYIRENRIYS
ncbi:MAG: hypothetical protein B6D58_01925 [candidate division Zixibacteria bacterium 4484_95]|nr:MAG: hypothetical protein B6D58_01925 [candidate division Zixibacteria bacterium 4484_95]